MARASRPLLAHPFGDQAATGSGVAPNSSTRRVDPNRSRVISKHAICIPSRCRNRESAFAREADAGYLAWPRAPEPPGTGRVTGFERGGDLIVIAFEQFGVIQRILTRTDGDTARDQRFVCDYRHPQPDIFATTRRSFGTSDGQAIDGSRSAIEVGASPGPPIPNALSTRVEPRHDMARQRIDAFASAGDHARVGTLRTARSCCGRSSAAGVRRDPSTRDERPSAESSRTE